MPIRVKADGSFETDSVAEAIELQRALLNGKPSASPSSRPRGRPRKDRVSDVAQDNGKSHFVTFWSTLEPDLRRLLTFLAKNPDGQTTNAIGEFLGQRIGTLPPTMKRFRNRAISHGLGSDFIQRESHAIRTEGKVQSIYKLKPSAIKDVLEHSEKPGRM